MLIQAPWPLMQQTTVMPDPVLGDTITPVSVITIKRSLSSTYVYVKRSALFVYNFNFTLSRSKSDEFETLFQTYGEEQWKITFGDLESVGYVLTNPIIRTADRRGTYSRRLLIGSRETVTLAFEFEGTR